MCGTCLSKSNGQEVFTKIQTLLALERNYLSEERTAMAQFRTGLTLAFIGPTASAIFAYFIGIFTVDQTILLDLLNFTFFSIFTIYGLWTVILSQKKIKIIKRKKQAVKNRTMELCKSSEEYKSLLDDCEYFE